MSEVKAEAGSAGMRCGVPAAASRRARVTTRFASSILKALSPDGVASASAASAARAKASRSGAAPSSSASAARARQGLAATPPSASRACRIVPPSICSAAAAETSAKAKEVRSRSFR